MRVRTGGVGKRRQGAEGQDQNYLSPVCHAFFAIGNSRVKRVPAKARKGDSDLVFQSLGTVFLGLVLFSVPGLNIFWVSLFSALVLLFGPLSYTNLHDHDGGYGLHSWSRKGPVFRTTSNLI